MRKLQLWSIILFCVSLSSLAFGFEGKVVAVTDGDTIKVMHNGKAEKIRLNGIDCPESGQPFGQKAKQFTSDRVFGKTVTVMEHGQDKYGRTIGDVYLDGKRLNSELVKAGFAWWYRQYSTDKSLGVWEQYARDHKLGLWADKNPTAPWDWRHHRGSLADAEPNYPATQPTTQASQPATAPATFQRGKYFRNNGTETVYVTRTGKKYHRAGCRYAKNAIPIPLKDAAGKYTPCAVCTPPVLRHNTASPGPVNHAPGGHKGSYTGETTAHGDQIYTGPRGGRYHYSASGKKVYERRKK